MRHRHLLESVLAAFSLSGNSQQIYITSFEQGEQSIGRLADRLSMDRSSAYLAVDRLKAAGLVEVDETKRPKTVRAIEPRKVLGRIERKIQDLEEVFDNVHTHISDLEAAYRSASPRPIMQAHSGKDGLQQIIEDILNYEGDEILLFTNPIAEKSVFTKHDHEYFIRKRKQKNVAIRVIAIDSDFSRQLQDEDKLNLRTTKILKGESPFSCEVYIYGNSIAMLSFNDEVIGFIINSPDFAEILRWQFVNIWEGL